MTGGTELEQLAANSGDEYDENNFFSRPRCSALSVLLVRRCSGAEENAAHSLSVPGSSATFLARADTLRQGLRDLG